VVPGPHGDLARAGQRPDFPVRLAGGEPDEAFARFLGMGGDRKPEWRELVIVPTHASAGAGGETSGRSPGAVQLEVRLRADGTRTLPVFSSVARLMDELGPQQPWICLPMRAAAEAATRAAVDRVALDPVLGPGAWPASSPS